MVEPEPDDSQFFPRIDGDYLWGRGAADMKTVVATYLVWLKDALRSGKPVPPIALLLVGNEENGETEAMGTPHVLKVLKDESGYSPSLLIAGERTGENGRRALRRDLHREPGESCASRSSPAAPRDIRA